MNNTLLLTSIAPPISRETKEIDREKIEWTLRCINSWTATGHDILSMNTPEEITILTNIFPNIEFKTAFRSTSPINNRPLIYISDIVNAAKKTRYKRFAICNSDILITESVRVIEGTEFDEYSLYSNRINIASEASTEGEIFYGIDYFNLEKKLLHLLTETLFAFGMPWWDYWYPYFSLRKNNSLLRIVNETGNPILLHKKHMDAWNAHDLCTMGKHFMELTYADGILNIRNNLLEKEYSKTDHSSNQISAELFALLARSVCSFIQDKSQNIVISKK